MQWSKVINDPHLQDLPYKIELNEYGKIVMSPATNIHGLLQGRVERFLWQTLAEGETFPECSILTDKGVKVADVVWCSERFIKNHGFETPYSTAPDICVEIVSPSNSRKELKEKTQLYLHAGAREVWIICEDGQVELHDKHGKIAQSKIAGQLRIDMQIQHRHGH